MATDTVTDGSDDADDPGSLRYQLAHASAGDTINFAPGVTSVALSSTLTITKNVTIEGANGVTITGGGAGGGFSDFTIAKGVNARFDDLVITNGYFQGEDATLAPTSPTQGGSGGGAITDYGHLTLDHTTISGNTALGGAGSNGSLTGNFHKGGGAGGSASGGIYVAAGAELDLVGRTNTFAGNEATGGAGGQGGNGFYSYGGYGGVGGHATTVNAHGPSSNQRGGRGDHGGGYGGNARSKRAGGAGGRAGMPGKNGKIYTVYVDAGYGKQETGSGGGGGGGNAFADFGGAGIVHRVAAGRAQAAAVVPHLCFAQGTRIAIARGRAVENVAVEDLRIGDRAVTASGGLRPIRWIGHRRVAGAGHAAPDTWPVRIRAGAFGAETPARDLYLSPGHPVLVGSGSNEVLVPVMCLVNGTSIARVPVERLIYWHVELDAHDILLAEGLPAESFLDWGTRPWFENADDHAQANPDFIAPGLGGRCRPVAIDGPRVEAERRRLDALFASGLAAPCAWPSPHEGVAAMA